MKKQFSKHSAPARVATTATSSMSAEQAPQRAVNWSHVALLVAGCSIAEFALAQTAPAAAAEPAAPTVAAPAVTEGIQEVIVTAQRRQEASQRASVSIDVLTAASLATRGVNDSQSLNDVVTGLKIAYAGSQVQTFVRGVGDVSANGYTQASVSLNVDGVYLARTQSFGPIFFDVARVEVLRGPQGTLYGRNASGGAINVITKAPRIGATEGFVSAELGNYDLHRLQGAVNVPVSDTFALRFAAQKVRRDGYLTDGSNDEDSNIGRLRGVWLPVDDVKVNFTIDGGHQGGNGAGRVYRPALFGNPWTGSQDVRITPDLYPNLYFRNNNSIDNEFWSATGQLDWTISDAATLTILPAYRYLNAYADLGSDFVLRQRDISKQKSLEVRLGGEVGKFQYVVGAYGFKEDLSINIVNDQRVARTGTGNLSYQIFPAFDTKAAAVFGETTYEVVKDFRVVGGLRYTRETRSSFGQGIVNPYRNGQPFGAPRLNFVDLSVPIGEYTWRAGLEYDVAPRSMLYANASTGFKSGGFSASIADVYNPEYVTAYQIGSKNRFLNNTLQANLEAFLWKYKDQQIAFLGIDALGNSSFLTRNAGQSTIYGANLDIEWQPTKLDTFTFSTEYLHTNYDRFVYSTPGNSVAGSLRDDGCLSGGPDPVKPGSQIVDCTGQRLQRAPLWSGNTRYTHRFDLADGGNITVGGTVKYSSASFLQLNFRSPNFRQDSYQLYDADAMYTAPNGKWSLQVYGRNLRNKAVYVAASNQSSIAPATGPERGAMMGIGNPRTFGAVARYNF